MSAMIDKIISLDQKLNTSHSQGFLKLHWFEPRLTWIAQEWAGIDLVYMNSSELWKPDIYIINQVNWETYNIATNDNQLVRLWADRSNINDLTTHNVNIDWSPKLSFELHHPFFDMQNFPLDDQWIDIILESWMSLPSLAKVKF